MMECGSSSVSCKKIPKYKARASATTGEECRFLGAMLVVVDVGVEEVIVGVMVDVMVGGVEAGVVGIIGADCAGGVAAAWAA